MKSGRTILNLLWIAGSLSCGFPTSAQTSAVKAATPIAASASTAVPTLIPYSGLAMSENGKAVAGQTGVTFLIFKEEQGGEPLFTETQAIVIDATGHYTANLGATLPSGVPVELFSTGEARWLEVQVAGQKPQARVLLASVPYALKAADAANLGGLPASAYALAGTATAAGVALAGPAAIIPDTTSTVTTTGGTGGYLPQFSGKSTIVDSILYASPTGIGVGDVPNSTAVFDVNGKSIWRGLLNISRAGTATTKTGFDSFPIFFQASTYNSSSKAAVLPNFQWQAEPTGNNTSSPGATFNFLSSKTGSTPAETGLYFNTNGTIHFASGQTFPGTGSGTITGVTAGTGLTGGGTSGKVTLNISTGDIPTLAGNNTFSGSNVFVPSIYEDTDINIDNNNSNSGSISPGLRFGQASGEGMSSQRTSSGAGDNQYGLDFYTDYARRMSITEGGLVAINGRDPIDQLEVNATGGGDAIYAAGTYTSSFGGTNGVLISGGSTDNSSGSRGGYGGFFFGGDADTAADAGYGIYVFAGQGTDAEETVAGQFIGDIIVNGNTYSAIHASKVDDPLDPANKYLVHTAVQSSEMMNIYSGNVTTDELGLASVQLPGWFEAENSDFRYQLTVLGQFAQAIVKDKIANKQFTIMTNASHVEVSWQITAVRQDAYAKAHPLVVEQTKNARERGFYVNPELFGQPKEKQTEWGRNPRMMQRMQAERTARKPHPTLTATQHASAARP